MGDKGKYSRNCVYMFPLARKHTSPGSHNHELNTDGCLQILEQKPTPENVTMLQAFEWFCPDDGKHWQRLKDAVTGLKATGIDNIWVPPGCKGSSPQSNGYDIVSEKLVQKMT